jgi:hypothetical protein
MKKIISASAMIASLGFASAGRAEVDFDQLQALSKVAFSDFSAANPDHVQHFTGFKAWKSGDDGRVKIYVNHDGMAMEYTYLCHFHDEEPECHLQN